jgi:hypothetical protein
MATPTQSLASLKSGVERHPWTAAERILFRFAIVYWTLYCLPSSGRVSVLDVLPVGVATLNRVLMTPWTFLCPWVAVHVFHLSGPVTEYHPTGSGDTTLDYVQSFSFLLIAAIVTLLWSILDRRKIEYQTLYAWLRILVRYALAITLLSYGFAKIYPGQFVAPTLIDLTRTYGQSSPMGLLWTFMGASTPYTVFGGLCEATAGFLLLFRRTTLLGALVATGAMLNVVLLNFCYDVPVKLYSTHILLMALFLLLPDMKALWRFFILQRPAEPEGLWIPPFRRKWLRIASVVLQVLVIASLLYGDAWEGYKDAREDSIPISQTLIHGVWDVDDFVLANGVASLPAWKRLVVETVPYRGLLFAVHFTDGTLDLLGVQNGADQQQLELKSRFSKQFGELKYVKPDGQHLVLSGTLNGQAVEIRLHQAQVTKFLLTNRGFHWISEDPFHM